MLALGAVMLQYVACSSALSDFMSHSSFLSGSSETRTVKTLAIS